MTRLALALGVLALLVPASGLSGGSTVGRGEAWIFYYPWYGTPQWDGAYRHWGQGDHVPPLDLATSYYPARGPYSSSDPAVVAAQMREIARAGVNGVVVSWWGWGSFEDQRLPLVLRLARRDALDVAVQVEPYTDRSAQSVEADITHLLGLGIRRLYVYQPFAGIDDADWAALLAPLHGLEVLAQTRNVRRAQGAGFSGVYTYDIVNDGGGTFGPLCAAAHEAGLLCEPSVGPGYDALRATGDTHVVQRRDGATYDAMWRAVLAADPDGITITSYNEWHEGTQIEPALSTPRARVLAVTPVLAPYGSYGGAFGRVGRAAADAYLLRTACWTAAFRLSAARGGEPWHCAGDSMQPRPAAR